MKLTKQSEYGLIGLVVLVEAGETAVLPVAEIAASSGISPHLLTWAFSRLGRAGMIVTQRGPGGGCSLAKSATEMSLADVITAIEGEAALDGCPFWSGHSCSERPCLLHDRMVGPANQLRSIFRKNSLADYVQEGVPEFRPEAKGTSERERS